MLLQVPPQHFYEIKGEPLSFSRIITYYIGQTTVVSSTFLVIGWFKGFDLWLHVVKLPAAAFYYLLFESSEDDRKLRCAFVRWNVCAENDRRKS